MRKLIAGFFVCAALSIMLMVPAFANTVNDMPRTNMNNTYTNTNNTAPGTMYNDGNGVGTRMNNYATTTTERLRATAADTTNNNNGNWGWLGLIGLIGLVGLRGRNRENA